MGGKVQPRTRNKGQTIIKKYFPLLIKFPFKFSITSLKCSSFPTPILNPFTSVSICPYNENVDPPGKLTSLYQKFNFIAISRWFHPNDEWHFPPDFCREIVKSANPYTTKRCKSKLTYWNNKKNTAYLSSAGWRFGGYTQFFFPFFKHFFL